MEKLKDEIAQILKLTLRPERDAYGTWRVSLDSIDDAADAIALAIDAASQAFAGTIGREQRR